MRYYDDESAPEIEKRFFIGLDLGQSQDYTALAIIEQTVTIPVSRSFAAKVEEIIEQNCVHLQRYELRTPYPAIVKDVGRIVQRVNQQARQAEENYAQTVLAIDATGVGAPVVDLFRAERLPVSLEPIQIVAGATVSQDNGVTRVPKRDLVGTVQLALQNKTLKVAAALKEAATLTRELQNFQVKITDSANDVYGAWREGTHDDLVLAVALALWCAKHKDFRITQRERDIYSLLV